MGPRFIYFTKDAPQPGGAGRGTEDDPGRTTDSTSAADLEIEKRRLHLARLDPEEFSYFFDKYHDRIFQFVFWKIQDYDLAGQLTGEVFLTALEQLSRFTWRRYSFGAWLYQLARWEIGRHQQRRRRHPEVEFRPGAHGQRDEGGPGRRIEVSQASDLLRKCLARLDDDRHDIFILHYWQEMSVAQVAAVMKMTESGVKNHLQRGRRQLLQFVREVGAAAGLSEAELRLLREAELEDSDLRLIDDRDT